jgi:hypothetical protein
MAAVTHPIVAWGRPRHRPTGKTALVELVVLAAEDPLGGGSMARLPPVAAPPSVPLADLDLRRHRLVDDPQWIDQWRTSAFRHVAQRQLADCRVLDAVSCGYSIRVEAVDPADLTHLQLAWSVAARLAEATNCAVLDVFAATWHAGDAVAGLSPYRPFAVTREMSVIYETEPVKGFGHPVHTRGMVKFGRPDLIAGVDAGRIKDTALILNHLAGLLAEGDELVVGRRLRFDRRRTLVVQPYTPGARIPDVVLANDGLLLVDL